MELKAYQAYKNPELDIRYWRTSSGFEKGEFSIHRVVRGISPNIALNGSIKKGGLF